MTRRVLPLAAVAVFAITFGAGAGVAQNRTPVPMPPESEQGPPAAPPTARATADEFIPLDVEVVISRHRGEKRISNLVYSMAVNANEPKNTQLRMGAQVPIPMNVVSQSGAEQANRVSYSYQPTGTNIDCSAKSLANGRFQVVLQVDDNSVQASDADQSAPVGDRLPITRSFRASNTLILRDGQTRQFTAATDPVSGEVVRIEVKLTVVK